MTRPHDSVGVVGVSFVSPHDCAGRDPVFACLEHAAHGCSPGDEIVLGEVRLRVRFGGDA